MSNPWPLIELIEPPISGYWGAATPTTEKCWPARVVRNGDVRKDGVINVKALPVRWFSRREIEKAQVSRTDSILVSSGAYTGNVGQLSNLDPKVPVIVSNFVRLLRPRENVHGGWLHLLTRSAEIQRMVWPHTGGSAIPNLSSSFYSAATISFCPPPTEQRLIAHILDTLDTQIRRTEGVIAKLEQVKQGLLTDLLTRGIDDNGEVRPPPEKAPELYKDSPLGSIPNGWYIAPLSSLLGSRKPAMRSGPFGSALIKSELVSSGIPLLGIDNVHTEKFRPAFTRFVTHDKYRELSRYAVYPGDLMITIMGTVGRCCLVPENIGAALSSKHTWTISLDQDRYIPYLAMLQVNYSPWITRHFARDEQGGIMSAIRSETLKSALFPFPDMREQKVIAKRLRAIATQIDSERSEVAKLRLSKEGLMDDLLTGCVRVTPLLDDAERAAG